MRRDALLQIRECELFNVENLQRQIQSNRLMALELLSFISSYQVSCSFCPNLLSTV